MAEPAKKILAYQRGPLILTCEQSGEVPEDFLSTLTDEERLYVLDRAESDLEPVFYDVLSKVGAAGVLPGISGVLMDVHRRTPRVFASVDSIELPLVHEDGTAEFLAREYYEPFVSDLKRLYTKTEQRYGAAVMVHLATLPRFVEGKLVSDELVVFGQPVLDGSQPDALRDHYEESLVSTFPQHAWVGVNQKFFSTESLTKDLVERLSQLRDPVLATQ